VGGVGGGGGEREPEEGRTLEGRTKGIHWGRSPSEKAVPTCLGCDFVNWIGNRIATPTVCTSYWL
jgi:hypothetical protein